MARGGEPGGVGRPVAWNDSNRTIEDETGRLWDVLNVARHGSRWGGSRLSLRVFRIPNTPRATTPQPTMFVLHCGPGDDGKPVLTIMLEGED